MRTITVPTCPYDQDQRIYLRKDVTFMPGRLTSLVGCNGSGKSTLMMLIQDQLKEDPDILCLKYNDRAEGGSNLMSMFHFHGQMDRLAETFMSSEGERIFIGVGNFISGLRARIAKKKPKEIWIFLDAVGSGLSIDKIQEIREIVPVIVEDNPGIDVYFVVSTNEYEFTCGADCIDVTTFKHIVFKRYEAYRGYILDTRKKKDKREQRAHEK